MQGIRGRRGRLGIVLAAFVLVWTALAAPAAHADLRSDGQAAIDAYVADGVRSAALGAPRGSLRTVRPDGVAQDFTNGTVYYSPETGAHAVLGAILARYRAVGGPAAIGFPTEDEQQAGAGRFSVFGEPGTAAIYWSPSTRASLVTGGVLRAWQASGGVDGPFGYPASDTAYTGRADESEFAGPEGTAIAWSSTSGLTTVPAELAAAHPDMVLAAQTTEAAPASSTATAGPAAEQSWWQKWWPWVAIAAGVLLALILLGLLIRWLRRRKAAPEAPVAEKKAAEKKAAEKKAAKKPSQEKPPKNKASKKKAPKAEPAAVSAALVAQEAVDAAPASAPEPEAAPEPEIVLSDETALASALVVAYPDEDAAALTVAYVNNALGSDRGGDSDATHAWLHRSDAEESNAEESEETEREDTGQEETGQEATAQVSDVPDTDLDDGAEHQE